MPLDNITNTLPVIGPSLDKNSEEERHLAKRKAEFIDKRLAFSNITNAKKRCKISVENEPAKVESVQCKGNAVESRLSIASLDEQASLYVTALDVSDKMEDSLYQTAIEEDKNENGLGKERYAFQEMLPVDRQYLHDPNLGSVYASDIFYYLKSRESHFAIDDYMRGQSVLNEQKRAHLVNWLVTVQEEFRLNHETLYLAVLLSDKYFSKTAISESQEIQLVGACAILVASKYEETALSIIDDLWLMCSERYTAQDFHSMERDILLKANFELGAPLSYSFLRRYARCVGIHMTLLTLARFVLELFLMDYQTVLLRPSELAASALYVAFKMSGCGGWNADLDVCTGYKFEQLERVVLVMNNFLHNMLPKPTCNIVKKYSTSVFFKVARTPLLSNEEIISKPYD